MVELFKKYQGLIRRSFLGVNDGISAQNRKEVIKWKSMALGSNLERCSGQLLFIRERLDSGRM